MLKYLQLVKPSDLVNRQAHFKLYRRARVLQVPPSDSVAQ